MGKILTIEEMKRILSKEIEKSKKHSSWYSYVGVDRSKDSSKEQSLKSLEIQEIELKGRKKKDFDEHPVLDRMEIQLKKSGIPTRYVKNVDLSWAQDDLSNVTQQFTNRDYILLFPFCSKKHQNKKWPFFKDLISRIRRDYKNKYSVLIAPGPDEIKEAKQLNAKIIMNGEKPINIKMLISLVNDAKFIISNDTGPAHIASHLNKKGLALFGNHTSAKKVSIENSNFKALSVKNLADLNVDTVIAEIKNRLN